MPALPARGDRVFWRVNGAEKPIRSARVVDCVPSMDWVLLESADGGRYSAPLSSVSTSAAAAVQ